jgi:multisubunit Na+/H+ antiporter MnhC subunit
MWSTLSTALAGEAGRAIRRMLLAAAFFAAAGIVATIALIFALLALHGWLSWSMSDAMASLVIALGLLLAAAVLVIVGITLRRRRKRRIASSSAALIAAPLAARLIGGNPQLSVAALAGIAALALLAGRRVGRD